MKEVSKPRAKKDSVVREVLLILASLVVIVELGIIIPLLIPDGTERYSGGEKAVAKRERLFLEGVGDGINRISRMHFKIRVESVRPARPEDAGKFCGTDPSQKTEGNYTVVLTYRSFFGIPTGEIVRYNCPPPVGVNYEQN